MTEGGERRHDCRMIRVSTMMVLLLLAPLLLGGGLAAPRSGDRLEVPEDVRNPFTLGPELLSLLQEYLRDEDPMEENTSDMKRETVILHLFVLHDFDKSGFLDGLELLRLLHRILATRLQREPAEESVVFLVDDILGTQDLNQDGLLSAQELVTPPVPKAEDSPPVNVALPVPPGARTGTSASENDPQTQTDTSEDEPAPPSETAQEEPAVTNQEAASVQRANESEEEEVTQEM